MKTQTHLISVAFCHTQRDKDLPRAFILGCQLLLEHLTVYSQLTLESWRGAVKVMKKFTIQTGNEGEICPEIYMCQG